MLTIIQGLGGVLRFQNLTPLALSVIGENIPRFWDLEPPAQLETLASAYHHLSRILEPSQDQSDLLEKLGAMVQRFEAREPTIAADNFTLSRLVGEMAKLKGSERPVPTGDSVFVAERSPAAEGTAARRPTPTRARDASLQFYTDGKGGFFPSAWAHLSDDMRSALKSRAFERKGKMSDLTGDEAVHAEFLFGAFSGWIHSIWESLTENGAKAVWEPVPLIAEMTAFLGVAAASGLSPDFWRLYGRDVDLRTALNRLTTQRSLLGSLEEGKRAALEQALVDLDAAYLRVLLKPLASRPDDAAAESGSRDESYGDTLATRLGDALVGLPLSDRSELSAAAQVQLMSAVSVLRILLRELPADPVSPAVRGFLKRLSPREMLQLAQVVELVSASPGS